MDAWPRRSTSSSSGPGRRASRRATSWPGAAWSTSCSRRACPGSSWLGRWDSFTLVGPNHTVRLPGRRLRRRRPRRLHVPHRDRRAPPGVCRPAGSGARGSARAGAHPSSPRRVRPAPPTPRRSAAGSSSSPRAPTSGRTCPRGLATLSPGRAVRRHARLPQPAVRCPTARCSSSAAARAPARSPRSSRSPDATSSWRAAGRRGSCAGSAAGTSSSGSSTRRFFEQTPDQLPSTSGAAGRQPAGERGRRRPRRALPDAARAGRAPRGARVGVIDGARRGSRPTCRRRSPVRRRRFRFVRDHRRCGPAPPAARSRPSCPSRRPSSRRRSSRCRARLRLRRRGDGLPVALHRVDRRARSRRRAGVPGARRRRERGRTRPALRRRALPAAAPLGTALRRRGRRRRDGDPHRHPGRPAGRAG